MLLKLWEQNITISILEAANLVMQLFLVHPVKSITSGEGGLVLTNDKNLAEKLNC